MQTALVRIQILSRRQCGRVVLAVMLLIAGSVRPAHAQAPDPSPPQQGAPAASTARDETEQNIISVPTTESMRRFGSHFRITHRFARNLASGNIGALASDLFGIDQGAIIGLDYRFAPTSHVQLGVYRSMLFRTIQFSGRYDVLRQDTPWPVALSALVSVEGINNFRDDHAPALGLVVSRSYGRRFAMYLSPTFVWHSLTPGVGGATGHEGHDHEHPELTDLSTAGSGDENTAFVGIGSRVLLPKATYIALEISPRAVGFAPGRATWGVGIEKHTRGHLFQLNFSNSFGTTNGQLARGGERSNVYLGFNIARKF